MNLHFKCVEQLCPCTIKFIKLYTEVDENWACHMFQNVEAEEERVDDRSVDDLLSFINGGNEGKHESLSTLCCMLRSWVYITTSTQVSGIMKTGLNRNFSSLLTNKLRSLLAIQFWRLILTQLLIDCNVNSFGVKGEKSEYANNGQKIKALGHVRFYSPTRFLRCLIRRVLCLKVAIKSKWCEKIRLEICFWILIWKERIYKKMSGD